MPTLDRTIVRIAIVVAVLQSTAACDSLFTSDEERIERAAASFAAGKLRSAGIDARRVLQNDPDNGAAHLLLGQILFRSGDLLTAERELQSASRLGVNDMELGYEIDLALGRFDAVLARLGNDTVTADYRKGLIEARARFGSGNFAAAQALMVSLNQRYPSEVEPKLGVAEGLASQGNVTEAIARLDAAVGEHPDDPRVVLARGRYRLLQGQYESAIADFAAARAKQSSGDVASSAVALAGLVEANLALQRVAEARTAVDSLARLAQGAPLTLALQGRVAAIEGDFVTASSLLRRVLQAQPGHIAARHMLASVLLNQGEYYLAEQQLDEIIRREPGNLPARKLLAMTRLGTGRPGEATEALGVLLDGEFDDPELVRLAGETMLRAGRFREAAEWFARALTNDPTSRILQQSFLVAAASSGDHAYALQLADSLPVQPGSYLKERLEILAGVSGTDRAVARDVVERLLAASSDDPEALNLAAVFYLTVGDLVQAEQALARARGIAPQDVNVLLNVARLEAERSDFAAAAAALETVLEIQPAHSAAVTALVGLALRDGDVALAQARLGAGGVEDEGLNSARLQLARALFAQGQVDAGHALLEQAAASAPDNSAVIVAASMLLIENGRPESALEFNEELKRRMPNSAGAALGEAYARFALGQTYLARTALQRVLQLDRESRPGLTALALLEESSGDVQQALEMTARLEDAYPESAGVHALRGDILLRAGRPQDALEAYEAALRLNGTAPYVVRAYNASQAAGLPNPERRLERALAANPDNTDLRFALAQSYIQRAEWGRAVPELEIVAQRRPNDGFILNNLAWAYHELGDARAEATARRARTLAPDSPEVADTLGWLLLENGNVAEALELLRGAAAAAPLNFEIQYHLAMALKRNNNGDEARAILERLAESDASAENRARAELAQREL